MCHVSCSIRFSSILTGTLLASEVYAPGGSLRRKVRTIKGVSAPAGLRLYV